MYQFLNLARSPSEDSVILNTFSHFYYHCIISICITPSATATSILTIIIKFITIYHDMHVIYIFVNIINILFYITPAIAILDRKSVV